MRALVTGGAGLIGSHIVDALLDKGIEVRILDNLEKTTHLKGKPAWVPEKAEFMPGEVEDRETILRALENVDLVFHQAAHQGFRPQLSKFFDVNCVGTSLILELIREKRLPVKRVIVASSQAVYGEGKYRCKEHGVMIPEPRPLARLKKGLWEVPCPVCGQELAAVPTDETAVQPRTAYAISKYGQEQIAIHLGKQMGIPTVALRYAITQGPRQSIYHAYSGVCSIFATRMVNGLPCIVYEDGKQTRDYVYVEDVARANILVMEKDEAVYGTFNVGTGVATDVLTFVRTLAETLGVEPIVKVPGQFRLGDIRHFRPDVSALEKLGWKAKTGLRGTLSAYAGWLREQGKVKDYFDEARDLMMREGVILQSSAREVEVRV